MSTITVDLKSLKTTGSITAGTNQLTVVDPTGFSVNDQIIVEIGTEAGSGLRGTVGVGGTWPQKSYANSTDIHADTSNSDPTWVWDRSTGNIWEWSTRIDDTLQWVSLLDQPLFPYYTDKAIPRSLVAKITDITDNVFTLSITQMGGPTLAVATATNANVYYDNALKWYTDYGVYTNYTQNNGNTLQLSSGTFYSSFTLDMTSYDPGSTQQQNIEITGAGIDQTIIQSPKGVCSAGLSVFGAKYITISNMSFIGNVGDEGYGLNWGTINEVTAVDDHHLPQGDTFPRGVYCQGGSNNTIHHVKVTDAWQQAVAVSFATQGWIHDCQVYNTAKIRSYIQWLFQLAACDSSIIENCYFYSPYYVPALEIFQSTDCVLSNMTSVNGYLAINSCDSWQVTGLNLTFTEGSGDYAYESQGGVYSINSPGVSINFNQGNHAVSNGGSLINPTIVYEGLPHAGTLPDAINISGANLTNINIIGTYPDSCNPLGLISYPDVLDDLVYNGYQINSDIAGTTTVSGIRVKGLRHVSDPRQIAIAPVTGDTVENCVADSIDSRITQNNCQTNATFDANYPDWHASHCSAVGKKLFDLLQS